MKIFVHCKDCDGSCLGCHSCAQSELLGTLGSEYFYVCRACEKTGCIMTKEEFDNLSIDCIQKQADAEKRLLDIEKEMFGE